MKTFQLEYNIDNKTHVGFVAHPDNLNSQTAVVLIVHMWSGRVSFVEEKAKYMAKKGYIGFAIDMYGEGKTGATVEENTALMQPFIEHRSFMQKHMEAAFYAIDQMKWADKNNTVAIGYCFGGLCVQDLARINSQVKGVVSIHGLMMPAANISQGLFKCKVLLLHGADDPMVSDEDWINLRSELNHAQCDWQKHDFGGVMHAFTNPQANDKSSGTVFNATADKRSNRLIDDFIVECFTD